jgi:hypothetical protein
VSLSLCDRGSESVPEEARDQAAAVRRPSVEDLEAGTHDQMTGGR